MKTSDRCSKKCSDNIEDVTRLAAIAMAIGEWNRRTK